MGCGRRLRPSDVMGSGSSDGLGGRRERTSGPPRCSDARGRPGRRNVAVRLMRQRGYSGCRQSALAAKGKGCFMRDLQGWGRAPLRVQLFKERVGGS